MLLRETAGHDLEAVLAAHMQAFGPGEGNTIADLVKAILNDPSAAPCLSLLAEDDGKTVGHVLFSKIRLEQTASPDSAASDSSPTATILAPLAVIPEAQNRGVGRALVEEGFARLSQAGVGLVFVLGYPAYYQRFGFQTAGERGFEAPFPIAEKNADAWMVRALRPAARDAGGGKVICCDALNHSELWIE